MISSAGAQGLMDRLVDLERGFWTGDGDFYRGNLTDDAVMVFPDPVGVLDRRSIVESISAASRWNNVEIGAPACVRVADGAALLTYRATAGREGQPPYEALASSLYVERGGAWRLAFHQQTPSDKSAVGE